MATQKDYLDLVFEQKNRAYGAYQLQKRQPAYVFWGFLISVFLLVIIFGTPLFLQLRAQAKAKEGQLRMQHQKVVTYSQLSAPPPIELNTPPPEREKVLAKPLPKAKKKFLPPVIKKDEEVPEDELIPSQEELKDINPGTKDVEGVRGADYTGEEGEEIVVIEPEAVEAPPPPPPAPTPAPPKEPEIYQVVEKMPSFPGGEAALFQFLARELIYPSLALENNIQGVVVVQFIVEQDGSITGVTLIRGVGGGCDEEALRVVKRMPNWEPGIQNDRKVRVRFNMPIRFKIVGDD